MGIPEGVAVFRSGGVVGQKFLRYKTPLPEVFSGNILIGIKIRISLGEGFINRELCPDQQQHHSQYHNQEESQPIIYFKS